MKTYPNGSKAQWERQAQQIVEGVIPTSASDVPMLLEWLRDLNWPGAPVIAKHLPSYGTTIGPALVVVMESGDRIWIRWVLAALSDSFDGQFWQPMRSVLQRIAYSEDAEGAAVEALYILARYKLDDASKIQTAIMEAKRLPGNDPDDYLRVEAQLVALLDETKLRE